MMTKYTSLLIRVILALASIASCGAVNAAEQYNELEDAVVAMAKRWQSGEKALPIRSSDGKILFAYGQSMPRLTCSPARACDIEMEPGERVKTVGLGDKANWSWEGAESGENGKTVQHVVIQPRDTNVESNAIIFTDRRTYHIRLYSPKVEGAYLNRVGFYYPGALVSSWAEKMGAEQAAAVKEESRNVMPTYVSPEKFANDYRIDGSADFKPLRVFNDGERTYIALPDSVKSMGRPSFNLLDDKGQIMVVNFRETIDEETGAVHYVVDKLFAKAELRRDSEKVTISWKRKEKSFWSRSVD